MPRRYVIAYFAVTATLAALYFALPEAPRYLWTLIGLSSVASIVVGVLVNRPRHQLPWWLVAAGTAAFIAGDTTYDLLTGPFGMANPFPSLADVLYLCTYPLFAAGLLLMMRRRAQGRDWQALVDALVITIGIGLLFWVLLVAPYAADRSTTRVEKAFSIAYPLGDVLLMAVLVRLLVSGARRSWSLRLLTLGTVALMASDVLYGLIQLNGDWQTGGLVDAGWVVFYIAWGGAAVHPDMVRLSEPVRVTPTATSQRRLLLIGSVSLLPPAVLVVESARGNVHDVVVVACASAAMFVLVTVRLSGMVGLASQSTQREAVLRRTGESRVGAVNRDQIYAVSAQAVLAITEAPDEHRVLIGVAKQGRPQLVFDSAGESVAEDGWLDDLVERYGDQLRQHHFVLTRSDQAGELLSACLRPGVPVLLAAMLRRGTVTGLVAVTGAQVERAALIDAVCAMAAQTAMALESAGLTEKEQGARVAQERSDERARIAREMHDVLAHRMSLVAMYAGALAYRSDLTSDEAREAADVIQSKANEALVDLRHVLGVLRSVEGDSAGDDDRPQPTYGDLPGLIDEARQAGMTVELESTLVGDLSDQVGRTVYRVVQEGLTNARKHGSEGYARVTIDGTGDGPGEGVLVTVWNPTTVGHRGSLPGAGLGLIGLTERVKLAGGRLAHRSDSLGFTLSAWLPTVAAEAESVAPREPVGTLASAD